MREDTAEQVPHRTLPRSFLASIVVVASSSPAVPQSVPQSRSHVPTHRRPPLEPATGLSTIRRHRCLQVGSLALAFQGLLRSPDQSRPEQSPRQPRFPVPSHATRPVHYEVGSVLCRWSRGLGIFCLRSPSTCSAQHATLGQPEYSSLAPVCSLLPSSCHSSIPRFVVALIINNININIITLPPPLQSLCLLVLPQLCLPLRHCSAPGLAAPVPPSICLSLSLSLDVKPLSVALNNAINRTTTTTAAPVVSRDNHVLATTVRSSLHGCMLPH